MEKTQVNEWMNGASLQSNEFISVLTVLICRRKDDADKRMDVKRQTCASRGCYSNSVFVSPQTAAGRNTLQRQTLFSNCFQGWD
ncbi:hypothetical protein JOB18_026495 [Solea senegalensis]|uniref:Uncharacterized protein n=1 Tax=Solea senegalensis TaxID=28829 RepID=A0AAV6SH73_SOLSE|nr:hypothetical protein JOB18_026495 [Solea senegalensis]